LALDPYWVLALVPYWVLALAPYWVLTLAPYRVLALVVHSLLLRETSLLLRIPRFLRANHLRTLLLSLALDSSLFLPIFIPFFFGADRLILELAKKSSLFLSFIGRIRRRRLLIRYHAGAIISAEGMATSRLGADGVL
jgi:hypothetical protein